MPEQTVTVVEKRQLTTDTGKRFWVIDTDYGEFYVWSPSLAEKIQQGRKYQIRYRDGDYPRVTGISEPGGLPSEPKVEEKRKEIPAPSRIERINRTVALKCATEVAVRTITPDMAFDAIETKVIELAECFEKWLNRREVD